MQSTEDLTTTLEDHQVNLSTMKASRFAQPFSSRIAHWEKVLATISEVIDTQLGVQRQWMYLESIFLSSDDIRKQLPTETAVFDQVRLLRGPAEVGGPVVMEHEYCCCMTC